MARKRTRPTRKIGRRVAARFKRFKQKTMRFRSRFRRFRRPRFRFFRRRRSFRRSGGMARIPFVGRRTNRNLIFIAVIGGLLFFFKDAIKPFIEKYIKKTA